MAFSLRVHIKKLNITIITRCKNEEAVISYTFKVGYPKIKFKLGPTNFNYYFNSLGVQLMIQSSTQCQEMMR